MGDGSRYRLVRTIASGGMASVYEGVAQGERGFERRVAIKRILPQHAADVSMRRMFFDEARIASRLHHANVVQVVDFGVVDGDDFLVMEFVDGLDAQRAVELTRRRGAGMDEGLALHVVAEVAYALAYAHTLTDADGEPLGIVHRDVSPHNVLLSWEGDVKLSDFGIALSAHREERTQTGMIKGKLAYMPYEQARGDRVTGAADVYALGATLHALVAGDPPHGLPGDALRLDASLTDDVRAVVAECMSPEPEDRPDAETVGRRCGALAAARLAGDGRGALRDWLAPLRGQGRQVKALDDLMGLALVPVEAEGGDDLVGGRHFSVSRATAAPERISRLPTAPGPRAAAADPTDDHGSVRLPTRRAPGVTAWILGVVLVGAAGVIAWWGPFGGPSNVPAAQAEETAEERGEARASAEPPGGSEVTEAVAPEPSVAVAPEPSSESETEPRRRRETQSGRARARLRAQRAERRAEEPAPAPEEDPAPAPNGWVRVPRGSAGHERVVVDGVGRGFTPTVLQLPAGEHRLVIRSADDGAVLFDRSVRLGPQHTRVSPLVVGR